MSHESFFAPLPSYLGGKRSLLPVIMRAVTAAGYPPARGHVLLDAFMGGGSVSWAAKKLGYRVLANDVSTLSEAVGRALIENSRTQLEQIDVELALTTEPGDWFLPPVRQLKWPDNARNLVAGICRAAEDYESVKRDLLRAFAVKTMLAIARFGQPRMAVGHKVRDGRYDEMTAAQAQTMGTLTKPRKVALTCAKPMYGAVFSNGQQNEMHCGDVIDFLSSVQGDVAYLDPPYPGTESYESNYVGIESLLGNKPLEAHSSRFTAAEGWKFLGEVFDAAEHVPLWVLSCGNDVIGLDELSDLMRERGRQVEAREITYGHMVSRADAETTEGKRELLLVARRAAAAKAAA